MVCPRRRRRVIRARTIRCGHVAGLEVILDFAASYINARNCYARPQPLPAPSFFPGRHVRDRRARILFYGNGATLRELFSRPLGDVIACFRRLCAPRDSLARPGGEGKWKKK